MDEMQVTSEIPKNIQLDQPVVEPKSTLTRKQESEQRRADFYKQLSESRGEPTPVAKESLTTESVDANNAHTETDHETDETYNELDSKHIPKKRFDKELEKRKVLEDELRRERDARIKFETELTLYNKAIDSLNEQQRQPEKSVEIDPIDTDAHNLYMSRIKDLENKFDKQKNNLSEYEIKQNFTNTVNHQAAEMAQIHPDFNDAYNYLLQVESNKGRMLGLNDSQSQEYALQQLQPIAWQAYNRGQNVAEVAYNIAKSYGYQTKVQANKANINTPNLDKIERNMAKSYSALDEIPGVSTSVAPEHAAYTTIEGFERKLSGKGGRGTNINEFYKAMEKFRTSGSY